MKDLITTIASILLLMVFVMQFAGSQVTHNRLFLADMAVESFRDGMKEEGFISAANRQRLTEALAEICGCSMEEIVVEGTEPAAGPAERGTLLYYQIRFPLQNLIVLGPSLGIGEQENMAWINQKGWVVSRYEKPDNNAGDSASDDDGDGL